MYFSFQLLLWWRKWRTGKYFLHDNTFTVGTCYQHNHIFFDME